MTSSQAVENTEKTNESAIIASIREEQKYKLVLLSVLHEQLAEFDIGKTPDFEAMLKIMEYSKGLTERFNHSVKNELIQRLIDNSPDGNIPLENLLAEQRHVTELGKTVIKALKALLKEHTILREEQLKIFSKNYVELLEAHIDIENQHILDNANLPITDADLQRFSEKLTVEEDLSLTELVEDRYKELSKRFSQSIDELEEAASDLAFAEFIGMSALFDSIEPLSLGLNEISQIVKEYSYQMFVKNYHCYKALLTQKQETPRAYLEQPMACLKEAYKDYLTSREKISTVWQKTRDQVAEPYEIRKNLLKRKNSAR